jgi:hypothetical protein
MEKFWNHVEKTETCWLWRGPVGNHGYGVFYTGSKRYLAHRWVMGDIPKGMHIDHLCRVVLCVRPLHLEIVTPGENTRRATPYRKSRTRTHCANGHEITPSSHVIRVQERSEAFRCLVCDREKSARYAAKRALP